MVEGLARRAGLPMPALYVIHEDQPNAFATGRNPENAAVAVNTGLLDLMSEQEIAGWWRMNWRISSTATRSS